MRKSNQEITDPKILEEILSGAEICRLAMLDGKQAYILPFNYGYREGCIYIHSAPEGKKIDLLNENNKVCFELESGVKVSGADNACGWATRYRSVVGYGAVEIISDDDGKKEGLEIIMAQHGAPDLIDFSSGSMKNMVILKLTIDTMSGKQSSNWDLL